MIYLNGFSCKSALGLDDGQAVKSLTTDTDICLKETYGFLPHGEKAFLAELPVDPAPLPNHDCRANRLLNLCLDDMAPLIGEIKSRFSPDRIGVVIGTSTSAITDVENEVLGAPGNTPVNQPPVFEEEDVYELKYDPRVYEIGNISAFVREKLGLTGPCYSIATACSSGGRAFVSASAMLNAGICDAVIVGACDTLSRITVSGFHALGALDTGHCRPMSAERKGINIGEGAGITIATREPLDGCYVMKLLGFGSSTDGYHISAPHPEGKGAVAAIEKALAMAGLSSEDIGYVNLHATGTKLNDDMEHRVISQVFGSQVPVSGVKHLTGHTLGAAGVVEAYVAYLILRYGLSLPAMTYLNPENSGEFADINIVKKQGIPLEKPYIMSNNFAFGGNNISLIFGKGND